MAKIPIYAFFESESISAYLKLRQPTSTVTAGIFNVRVVSNSLHALNYLKKFHFWNKNKKQIPVIESTIRSDSSELK